MELKNFEHIVVRGAFQGTKWENLLFFLEGSLWGQKIVFCPEMKPEKLMQLEKKVPEAFLMAAVVENRILDRGEIQALINMPTIDILLGETVSILNSPAQKTLRLLNSNQQNLSTNLNQYVKDKS